MAKSFFIAQSFELSTRIEKYGFILKTKQNWWHFHAHLLEPNGLDAFCAHSGYLHNLAAQELCS